MKNNLLFSLVFFSLLTLLLGLFFWLLLKKFSSTTLENYFLLPLLFYFSGLTLMLVLQKFSYISSTKKIYLFLLLKLSKMILWGIVAFVYLLVFRTERRMFGLLYGAYYLIYLIFETACFYMNEKRQVRQSK